MVDIQFWFECIIMILIGLVGNCLLKIGVDKFRQKISLNALFKREFLNEAFFSWAGWTIAVSLLFNLVSRIMLMGLLSKERLGIVLTLTTPLGLSAIVIAGYFIFHETYTAREVAGILLTVIAAFLLSSGGES